MAALNILICSHNRFQRSTLISQLGHLGHYQPRVWSEPHEQLPPGLASGHDLLLVDPPTLPALLERITRQPLHARALLCVDTPDERQQALLALLLTATGAHYLGALPLTLHRAARQVELARHLELLGACSSASPPALDDPLDDLHCRPFHAADGQLRYLALESRPAAGLADRANRTNVAAAYRLAAILEERFGARPELLLEIPATALAADDLIDALVQRPPGHRSRLTLSLRETSGSPSLPEQPVLRVLAETGIGLAWPDYDLLHSPLLQVTAPLPMSLLLSPGLTRGLARDPRRRVLAIHLQNLAQRCGGTLLAPGVEQHPDLHFLRGELDCPSQSDRLIPPLDGRQLLERWASLACLATPWRHAER